MNKLFLIIPIFLLVGCSTTVPVKRNFPDVPTELMAECPNLKQVEKGTEQLSKVITVVTENYGQYHECKVKVSNWIEWYNSQKKIFDEVK
jgi:uncharacterized protein YcfL